MLIPLVLIGYAAYRFFYFAKDYWFEGNPNEYVIICRDGKLVKSGVGLCSWVLPGDKIVSFPARLRQVNFSAQQVTLEMQGLKVSGMLIWSPHRDAAGPLKLYRAFGDQLSTKGSPLIFSTIEDMARSIIRDKISNMTIHDVLKNRSALRDTIRADI